MSARSARKLLAAWAAGRSYRKTTTARALRKYSRALKRLFASGQINWTKNARAWRWSWQLRGKSRMVGLRPGRLAWIAAGLALGETFRKERAQPLVHRRLGRGQIRAIYEHNHNDSGHAGTFAVCDRRTCTDARVAILRRRRR